MLNVTKANALLKKYGYKAKDKYPTLLKEDKNIGLSYLFVDNKGAEKEKKILFKTEEEMDLFLKKYKWFNDNKKNYNITMKLEKPKSEYTNLIYLKDGVVMENDEMFDLDKYDSIRMQKKDKKKIDSYLKVASDLLDNYYLIKDEHIALRRKLDGLLGEQRSKYFELQLLVDKYNKVNIEHKKLDVSKSNELAGINIEEEKDIKKKLSKYKNKLPKYEDIEELIKDIWNLTKDLEMNKLYYNDVIKEVDLANEIKLANKKLEFMNNLLAKRSILRKNLKRAFKKIDKEFLKEKKIVNDDFVDKEIKKVSEKYACFADLDILKTALYLNEYNKKTNKKELLTKYSIKK